MFPKFAAYSGDKRVLLNKTLLRFSVLFISILIVSYFVYPLLINNFFDIKFAKSISLFRILLIGVFCLGLLNIIESYLLGENLQKVSMVASGISAVLLVTLSILLIPVYGDIGASAVSSFVYFIYLSLIIVLMKRRFNTR